MTYPQTMVMPYRPMPPRGRGSLWRFWPDPPGGAGPWVYAAVGLVALVTAVTEPYLYNGIGGLLTGLAVVAVPVAVVAGSRAARWRLLRPLPLAAGAATVALLAVGTVRGAGWLYVLCVLTALGLGSYGLVSGRRWPAVFLAGATPLAALLRGIPWLARGVRRFRLGAAPVRTLAAVAATVLLVLIFGALFASADAAFDNLLSLAVPEVSARLIGRLFMAGVMLCFAFGVAFLARMPPRFDQIADGEPRAVRRLEWLLPLGALVALFATFVAVQLTTLFGGDAYVLRTAGLTYAEYARQGFGQLLVVTVLTLAVLAAAGRWAPKRTRTDRVLLRLVAGALCLLTLVIVASALYRLQLYQQAYGFTRLRLFADTVELWLGVVFVLILVAGIRLRADWLPRAVVGTGVAALLGLALLNPDAFIAERNIARYQDTGKIDTEYLGDLSADAVPALHTLPEPKRSCALAPIQDSLSEEEPWYAFNFARHRAESLLRERPPVTDCGTW